MTQPYMIYHVFAGMDYYPSGGMRDHLFAGKLVDCYEWMSKNKNSYDWYELVNSDWDVMERGYFPKE